MTAADIHGPWADHGRESGLVEQAKRFWNTPIPELPDAGLALFLRQRVAIELVREEARRRLAAQRTDGSELYDGELAAAMNGIEHADPAT